MTVGEIKHDCQVFGAITGHKDPRMLMRYTYLRAEGLARRLR